MKDVIEGLNLPKQLLDKTEKFMSTLFGSSAKEISGLFADKIRFIRMKNQVKIFKKTINVIEENGLTVKELDLKTLVPLIEYSSLEEDETLQSKWAILIANISSCPRNGLEPKLIKTLSNLSPIEAQVLDYIHSVFIYERKKYFTSSKSFKVKNYESEEEVELNYVNIHLSVVKAQFELSSELSKIIIENIESLGLIKFEDPEIEIDHGASDALLEDDKETGQKIKLELDVYANYYQSNKVQFTNYGKYFVEQCKSIKT